jgi:hypothetical protein
MPATYRINWDALLARVVYRWHWRIALGALLLAAALGLAGGLIPPVWRGEATLTVRAAPGATVLVDGRPWPRQLYAGRHTVAATLPDGRAAWAEVTLRAGAPITLTLPAGLPPPRVRPLPAAAPGMRVAQVWWADGAWRVMSRPRPDPETAADAGHDSDPPPGHTVAFGAQGAERLSTIDAYAGLADQLHAGGTFLEAVYRPSAASYGGIEPGTVEVRGWQHTPVTVPLSGELTLVRFAPDGDALLLAERTPAGGEQISLARAQDRREPVVAVPGSVRRLSWREDGSAVVLHSQSGDRLALTLVRLRPTIAAATIAELDAATYADALVPLSWGADTLLWIAPGEDAAPALWSAPLRTLIPERRGQLDVRVLDRQPDETLRVVTVVDGRLAIGRYQHGALIVEATAPDVPLAADLAGVWHSGELLLASSDGVWLLTFAE